MNGRWPQDLQRAVATVAGELGLVSPEVTPLPGGVANRALRLRDAQHDLVLRVAGAPSSALGASRASECAMQALAAHAGLAPAIVLALPEQGLLVARFADGRMLSREEARDPGTIARVGRWIARLHALPPPRGLPYVDFGARAAGYLQRLRAQSRGAEAGEIARRLDARRGSLPRAQPAACHHDLHHCNFIDDGRRLLAVDWEYAGPGDPAADLAAFAGYHDLGPAQVAALLAGYGTDSAALRARVAALGWIFDCLWYGWNAAAALTGVAPEPELQSRLAARLLA